ALFCLPLDHSMAYAGGTSVRVNTLSPVKTGIEEVVEIEESVQSFQSHVSKVVSEVSGAVIKLFNVNDRTGERRFTGSAVVVSPDGLVLTVAHVNVPGRVFVGTFPDGREVRVVGLGEINSMDAAMMRIEEKGNYPYVKLGYSSGLKHEIGRAHV